MKTLLLLALVSTAAHADYICEREAFAQEGDAYLACGLSSNEDEGMAREAALQMAFIEFNRSCAANAKCVNEMHSSESRRTECTHSREGFHCVRMIRVTVIPTDPRLVGAYAPGYGAFKVGVK